MWDVYRGEAQRVAARGSACGPLIMVARMPVGWRHGWMA